MFSLLYLIISSYLNLKSGVVGILMTFAPLRYVRGSYETYVGSGIIALSPKLIIVLKAISTPSLTPVVIKTFSYVVSTPNFL